MFLGFFLSVNHGIGFIDTYDSFMSPILFKDSLDGVT